MGVRIEFQPERAAETALKNWEKRLHRKKCAVCVVVDMETFREEAKKPKLVAVPKSGIANCIRCLYRIPFSATAFSNMDVCRIDRIPCMKKNPNGACDKYTPFSTEARGG